MSVLTGLGASGLAWRERILVTALFVVHPVHTESLLYLVGRADILCSVFFLIGLILYDKKGRIGKSRFILCYLMAVCAGLAKELGFMVLPLYFCVDLFRGRNKQAILTLFLTAFTFYVRHWYTDGTTLKMSVQDNPISFEADWQGRFLSYFYVHGEYGRLLAWPFWLTYDYSLNTLPIVCEWTDVRLMLPLACYSGLASIAVRAMQTKDAHALLAGIQFVLVFLPMSNVFFPVGTVVGERLLYLPSVSFLWLVVKLLSDWSRTHTGTESAVQEGSVGLSRSGLLLLTLVWGVRCYWRVDDWKSADHLVLKDGAINLKSAKTQFNLGVHHFAKKEYDLAYVALERSWRTDPEERDAVAFWRAGQIELLRGNVEHAEELLVAATGKYGAKLMVREEEVFHDAGLASYHAGKVEKAHYYLSAALTLNRQFPKALNNFACLEASRGHMEIAMNAVYEAALTKPRNVIYQGNAWKIAEKLGLHDIAHQMRDRALAIQASFIPNEHCTWEFKPAQGGPGDNGDDEAAEAEEEERKKLREQLTAV